MKCLYTSVGEWRFKSPQPAEHWVGVRDCTEVAPKCIQYNRYTDRVEGSEDCLFLNIYAKRCGKHLETENPLPVMVYIHGGGFATGTASRRFLKFSDPNLRYQEMRLKDIVMALKMAKTKLCELNGDPNNVTLFGHSAGSCATHVLISTPHCEGLFHKAILLSGLIMHTEELPNLRFRYAKHLGYEGVDDDEQIFNYLNSLKRKSL
ncbi:unnamed protein product [Ceratitis capitata]|uniref:(Mediterranean fruit fly) hypothetical protein n=1 Tax=Ceratitis capitata TaxID=7213 RepID=A0A811UDB9_CERCA|nr:unnamed protein product [Ceratitis capitata]